VFNVVPVVKQKSSRFSLEGESKLICDILNRRNLEGFKKYSKQREENKLNTFIPKPYKLYNKIQNYAYQQLRTNPFYGKNIKKLIDYAPPTWRYRIGDYRLFYEIDEHESIVYIIAIDIRSRAY
jgi:mRNA interferase RelE/StbE